MHEYDQSTAGALPALRKDLDYIPVCSDPRGVCVSELHKEGAILKEIHIRIERQNTLYNAMEKMMCVWQRVLPGNGVCPGQTGYWIKKIPMASGNS